MEREKQQRRTSYEVITFRLYLVVHNKFSVSCKRCVEKHNFTLF